MNYYFTYSDKNYTHIAERLFKSLQTYSSYKIIYYTINFDYENKFDNVIPIRYDFDHTKFLTYELNEEEMQHWTKKYMLYLKVNLCLEILKTKEDNNYCCIDSDMILIKNSDFLFDKINNSIDFPILPLNCYEYMLMDGHGNPFDENGNFDIDRCLEADLMRFLNISTKKRNSFYKQCNLLIFNKNSLKLFEEWYDICYYRPEIIKNKYLASLNEESVLNCLLWKYDYNDNFDHIHINIPLDEVNTFILAFNNPHDESFFLKDFCRIPEKEKIQNILFLHGRPNQKNYQILEKEIIYKNKSENLSYFPKLNKKLLLIINAVGMGDALTSTPAIRKLSNIYSSKISIISNHYDLFKNNPYVENNFKFNETIDKSQYEVFSVFEQNSINKLNKIESVRKHHACCTERSCAYDLGFDLTTDELQLDFFPTNDCIYDIKNFGDFICLHTTSNWKNRTWSNENWQELSDKISDLGFNIVIIGKDHEEVNFDKSICHKKCFVPLGQNVINISNDGSSINDIWHIIDNAKAIVTLDSGPLHLAGTTDTWIIQIGSARHPEFNAPFRKGSQKYKHIFVGGECSLFCASNLKYSVKEWNTINAIHYLPVCQENYETMRCQPNSDQVLKQIKSIINEDFNS
jgi:ADP-heptose:LPS heptosyltransferase